MCIDIIDNQLLCVLSLSVDYRVPDGMKLTVKLRTQDHSYFSSNTAWIEVLYTPSSI